MNGIVKFSLITTKEEVLLLQQDTWNCGVAIVAYILEFYIHQFNSPFVLNKNQYTLKKKGDHWTYEVDNSVYKLGQLWVENIKETHSSLTAGEPASVRSLII